MTDSIQRKVIRLVSRAAMVPDESVTPDTVLSTLAMDSLEQIECALSIEEAFQIEMQEPELWRFRTVADIIEAVRQASGRASR
jgi:acyl carrier protein